MTGCGAMKEYPGNNEGLSPEFISNGEEGDSFNEIVEKGFVETSAQTKSTFRLSVSTSSYTYMRGAINRNIKPNRNSIRIEEFINYFNYDIPSPTEQDTFNMTGNVFDCPWNAQNMLLRVSVKAKSVERTSMPSNLVFLLDTSGSMNGADRLPLVKKAFSFLAEGLSENDRVSIVTYAGNSKIVLDSAQGDNKNKILSALDELSAGGNTAGARGIETAYQLANKNFIQGGNNRVILATDGDFNVGISSKDGLKELISSYSKSGIYFTGVGVGFGNYKDSTMEDLATCGNGQAFYLDNISEAYKIFTKDLTGTLFTVANNAKAQVTFNPETVAKYRLIGYDNLIMSSEDFDNPLADAGEIGSGHSVTALYEIVPTASIKHTLSENSARNRLENFAENPMFASAEIRFTDVVTNDDLSVTLPIILKGNMSDDDRFVACVAEGGMLMRDSVYKGDASFDGLLRRLNGMNFTDEFKLEFKQLIGKAKLLY